MGKTDGPVKDLTLMIYKAVETPEAETCKHCWALIWDKEIKKTSIWQVGQQTSPSLAALEMVYNETMVIEEKGQWMLSFTWHSLVLV